MPPLPVIQRNFNYYTLGLYSGLYTPANVPNTDYSRSFGYITCYHEKEAVGYIKFFDRELIPPNSYIGSSPNSQPVLNFHISRFNDIMTILHYEKTLAIIIDPNTLQGSVSAISYEPVGEQEGV
jgi:hypothetical protein